MTANDIPVKVIYPKLRI